MAVFGTCSDVSEAMWLGFGWTETTEEGSSWFMVNNKHCDMSSYFPTNKLHVQRQYKCLVLNCYLCALLGSIQHVGQYILSLKSQ